MKKCLLVTFCVLVLCSASLAWAMEEVTTGKTWTEDIIIIPGILKIPALNLEGTANYDVSAGNWAVGGTTRFVEFTSLFDGRLGYNCNTLSEKYPIVSASVDLRKLANKTKFIWKYAFEAKLGPWYGYDWNAAEDAKKNRWGFQIVAAEWVF